MIGAIISLALPTFVVVRRTYQFGFEYWLRYGPGYTLFGQKQMEHRRIGPFDLNWTMDRRNGECTVTVTPGDVHIESGWRGRWYTEPLFDGQDITGNGRPNLLLSEWGGAGGGFFFLLEMRDGTAVLLAESWETSWDIDDVDGDGIYEWVLDPPDPRVVVPLFDPTAPWLPPELPLDDSHRRTWVGGDLRRPPF